ncbi:MAG: hypothetical protein HY712_06705 [candidate division NC10 bacterium]|nr:hypothetical protein [candidate division NC10 bacterium]
MLTYDPAIPSAQKAELENAVREMGTRLPAKSGNIPSDLFRRLDGMVAATADPGFAAACPPHAWLSYDPWIGRGTPVDEGPYAYTGAACIWICERTFREQRVMGTRRVAAVLLHELVHVLCGSELDAEAFEWLLFELDGATAPDGGDWESFRLYNMRGRWIYLDTHRTPPQIMDYQGRSLGGFTAQNMPPTCANLPAGFLR